MHSDSKNANEKKYLTSGGGHNKILVYYSVLGYYYLGCVIINFRNSILVILIRFGEGIKMEDLSLLRIKKYFLKSLSAIGQDLQLEIEEIDKKIGQAEIKLKTETEPLNNA